MSATAAKTGSRNGIEWRTDTKGHKSYRGVLNSATAGKQRGSWGTHAEAVAWRRKAAGEVAAGASRSRTTITLKDAADDLIAGMKSGAVPSRSGHAYKPTTIRGYENDVKKCVAELGAHRLSAIRRADVQAMVDRWASDGWESSTIKNALDPMRVIYRRALRRDLVAVNPCDGVEVPASKSEPMQIVSKTDAAKLIAALPTSEQPLWATAFYAGLRRGELQALTWADVDLKRDRINVSKSWDQEEGVQDPKTKAGSRTVPLVAPLKVILEAHRNGSTEADLVFGREPDKVFVPSTVRTRANAAWKKAQLQPMKLHQCRHNFASMMIDAGCNAKALSVVMGHASISITFDTYGKLMPGGEDEVGRLLTAYLAA